MITRHAPHQTKHRRSAAPERRPDTRGGVYAEYAIISFILIATFVVVAQVIQAASVAREERGVDAIRDMVPCVGALRNEHAGSGTGSAKVCY